MSTDLMDTFNTAVGYFNKFQVANWAQLEPLLHDNMNMKRIDDLSPHGYYHNKQEVRGYFMTRGKDDQADFTPDAVPDCRIVGDYGFVSGTAIFIDVTNRLQGGPTQPRKIAFSFTFKRGDDPSNAGNWQAIHSWGKYL